MDAVAGSWRLESVLFWPNCGDIMTETCYLNGFALKTRQCCSSANSPDPHPELLRLERPRLLHFQFLEVRKVHMHGSKQQKHPVAANFAQWPV
jgi:hypothetical protein